MSNNKLVTETRIIINIPILAHDCSAVVSSYFGPKSWIILPDKRKLFGLKSRRFGSRQSWQHCIAAAVQIAGGAPTCRAPADSSKEHRPISQRCRCYKTVALILRGSITALSLRAFTIMTSPGVEFRKVWLVKNALSFGCSWAKWRTRLIFRAKRKGYYIQASKLLYNVYS